MDDSKHPAAEPEAETPRLADETQAPPDAGAQEFASADAAPPPEAAPPGAGTISGVPRSDAQPETERVPADVAIPEAPPESEPAPSNALPGPAEPAPAPESAARDAAPATSVASPGPDAPKRTEAPPAPDVGRDLRRILEALLFASDVPLTPARIRDAVPSITAQAIRETAEQLRADYAGSGRAFELVEIAEGYLLLTRPEFEPWIARLKKVKSQAKLSSAALETLAIIAYKQPIRRVDVEAIRGVQSGELIRALMERGLIRIAGRSDQPGAPLLYGTTKDFLDAVGLKSVDELPKPEELKPEESKPEPAPAPKAPPEPAAKAEPEGKIEPGIKAETGTEAEPPAETEPAPEPGAPGPDGAKRGRKRAKKDPQADQAAEPPAGPDATNP
jgi:segregation and condensation protein B